MRYPKILRKTPGNETKFPSTMSDSRVWKVFLNEQSKNGMYAEVYTLVFFVRNFFIRNWAQSQGNLRNFRESGETKIPRNLRNLRLEIYI